MSVLGAAFAGFTGGFGKGAGEAMERERKAEIADAQAQKLYENNIKFLHEQDKLKTAESKKERDFKAGQSVLEKEFQAGEAGKTRDFQSTQQTERLKAQEELAKWGAVFADTAAQREISRKVDSVMTQERGKLLEMNQQSTSPFSEQQLEDVLDATRASLVATANKKGLGISSQSMSPEQMFSMVSGAFQIVRPEGLTEEDRKMANTLGISEGEFAAGLTKPLVSLFVGKGKQGASSTSESIFNQMQQLQSDRTNMIEISKANKLRDSIMKSGDITREDVSKSATILQTVLSDPKASDVVKEQAYDLKAWLAKRWGIPVSPTEDVGSKYSTDYTSNIPVNSVAALMQ